MNPWPLIFTLLAQQPAPSIEQPAAPAPATPIGPRIQVEPDHFDCGIVESAAATITSKRIRVTNVGDRPLMADNKCGCGMRTNEWFRTLAPGESYEYDIILDVINARPGRIHQTESIHSNDRTQPIRTVALTADYRPDVYLDRPIIQFGAMRIHTPGTAMITLNSKDKDFEIISVDTGSPLITWEPQDPGPARLDPMYPGRRSIRLILSDQSPVGSLSTIATIKTRTINPAAEQDLAATIVARVESDLVAEPSFIRVAHAIPGKPFEERLSLSSIANKPFTIISATIVESSLEGLALSFEPITPEGVSGYEIILSGKAGDTPAMFHGYFDITTDRPDEPPVRIQFNGVVREQPAPESPQSAPG